MKKLPCKLIGLFSVLIFVGVLGCAGGARGGLPRVQNPTQSELRRDWHDYEVFYRSNIALIYKFRDNKKIILDDRWVEITSEDMMAKSGIWDITWVRKIIGLNDQVYGYLVHRTADTANVKIIDANTVQLYYHYVRTSGGP